MALPPKKTRLGTSPLRDAIEEAGLTDKATVNGQVALSGLDYKERVSVLRFFGSSVDKTDKYVSLSRTALTLRNSSFQDIEKLSIPSDSSALFPVIRTEDLYVRQTYKDLYQEVSSKFQDDPRNRGQDHIVVTGTSGIGKSAFLVYFTIRLLATGSDDNPSIVIFQVRGESKCYVYGGLSTLRYGDITDFTPFLHQPETWYLVDSSPEPWLERAKTIISASPKALYFRVNQYKEVDDEVPWQYYMAPWTLEELERCWCSVEAFKVVPKNLMKELYGMVGGVPIYVLERPMKALSLNPGNIASAKESACERVLQAIDSVRASTMMRVPCFEKEKESLEHNNRLVHRWPTDDHRGFRLEWASTYIADKFGDSLQDVAWQQILEKLVGHYAGTAKGPLFELYDLQDGSETTLKIPANSSVELFKEISAVPPGTLCIPKIYNYACVDLLLSPRHLFQITVSKRHDIKEWPFAELLENLMDKGWIHSPGDAHLVFVVSSEIYDNFPEQKYFSTTGTVYERVPQLIQPVKQFVLKIDLMSASTGKSPGIRGPAY
ncbi:hypothetical protein BGZ51_000232 [Haplosporangium sp. Z 767]|nr:hypothetical protein BGZ51_000232 [Haplosporangium sp. Z 767]